MVALHVPIVGLVSPVLRRKKKEIECFKKKKSKEAAWIDQNKNKQKNTKSKPKSVNKAELNRGIECRTKELRFYPRGNSEPLKVWWEEIKQCAWIVMAEQELVSKSLTQIPVCGLTSLKAFGMEI